MAHCRYWLHTGGLQEITRKSKIMKPMAYGSPDEEDFFLRVRGCASGNRVKKTGFTAGGGGKDAVNPVATPPDQAALELSNYGSDSR